MKISLERKKMTRRKKKAGMWGRRGEIREAERERGGKQEERTRRRRHAERENETEREEGSKRNGGKEEAEE